MTRAGRLATAAFVLAAAMGSVVLTAQQARPEALLRAAMETETVKGDLKGAIEQYRAIAQTADRSLAAQALLRMAESTQLLRQVRHQIGGGHGIRRKDQGVNEDPRHGAALGARIIGEHATVYNTPSACATMTPIEGVSSERWFLMLAGRELSASTRVSAL